MGATLTTEQRDELRDGLYALAQSERLTLLAGLAIICTHNQPDSRWAAAGLAKALGNPKSSLRVEMRDGVIVGIKLGIPEP